MPTYEYRCPAGHVFEKFFPTISDQRRIACPKCRRRAQRVISGGAGLVFKGSGFYVTDYKRAGEKQPAEGEPKAPESTKPAKPKKDSSADK